MKRIRGVLALAVCASVNIYAQAGGDVIKFVSAEFGAENRPVKGAPYSAQAIVTTTQTLADGNRIVNKSSSFLARDSEGRTRREQTIKNVGPWSTGQSPVSMVLLYDAKAQVSYMLDPAAHTARKSMGLRLDPAVIEKMKVEGTAVSISGFEMKRTAEAKASAGQDPNMVLESLGVKSIEGVQAEGKRFTRTVPAGEIGNERALVFVNEVWTSPELHAVVMSRHVDPQVGETVYTLTNIQLAEPDPALFSVPADYAVTDAPKSTFVMERRERRER